MADQPKLKLDKNGLQEFVDHQIAPFKESLNKIANVDNEEGVTIDALLGIGEIPPGEKEIFRLQKPLAIGQLAADKLLTNGDRLVGSINETAQSISDIYKQQIKLFGDLHRNLTTTISKLMDAQHDSLEKIDGKIFLDSLGTVPGDFQGTNGGNNS
jgi:hypothetical protein